MARKKTDDVKDDLLAKRPEGGPGLDPADRLSTGSTLLNLALSGSPDWGWAKGRYYLVVGDSASGKTMLSLTAFAEASINPNFDDFRFRYNNPEDGALMDRGKFFGPRAAARIEETASLSVEEFYYDVDDCVRGARPCLYVLDSMDALRPEDDLEQFQKEKKAHDTGKKVGGSYGTAKSKINSASLPAVASGLKKSGSILLVICQTRDNIGFGSQFNPKTRSGGNSLRFYSQAEVWFAVKETLKRRVLGRERPVGILAQVRVKKNRQTGRTLSVEFPIYYSTGIDDVGSMVSYLLEEKHWKKTAQGIEADDFGMLFDKEEDAVAYVEQQALELELREVVTSLWRKIEEGCVVPRKNRYGG
jgi:RecA/RadA recombinase